MRVNLLGEINYRMLGSTACSMVAAVWAFSVCAADLTGETATSRTPYVTGSTARLIQEAGRPATRVPVMSAQLPSIPATVPPAVAPRVITRALPGALSEGPAQMGPNMNLLVGKSTLLRMPVSINRISVGNPAIADVILISQREIYFLGKDLGTTNVIVWVNGNRATVIDVQVSADSTLLEAELHTLLPRETDIKVRSSADSIVLTGSVSDAVKAQQAVEIAQAWIRRLMRGLVLPVAVGGKDGQGTNIQVGSTQNVAATAGVAGPRVINMLKIKAPMQVMLEVKVAEIAKRLLVQLGVQARAFDQSGNWTYDILNRSNFFNQLLGAASIAGSHGSVQLDAQEDNGLIKLLAEPNIMAISGQEASFRAGGKVFIPVSRDSAATGIPTITLEEKEFGVGLKFTPMVLEGGRINLKVAPEVSELQETGTPFTTVNGVTSVLPSFLVRRAETTVQLNDGQSFMIAGLIRSNAVASINQFPGLGDIPIVGALFRSTEFREDKTELMFVITPRLVKPLPANYALPTDNFIEPSPADLYLNGKLEGKHPDATTETSGGFETK